MTYRALLLTGMLFLAACVPTRPNQMGNGSMMGGNQGGMMQGSFLPARDKDVDTLPEAKPMSILEVENGDTITLNPELVRANIDGEEFAMYAYNGQFPGPTLKVEQGSTFTVNVTNNIDVPTTVHWHGIRLENKFDGAEGVTQEAIQPGDSFTYTIKVPDEGMFWYHPHVREDLQQDMGLAGNLWVTPKNAAAYNTVNREEVLMLDDILLDDGLPVPYGGKEADHALMGRFGNTMLINGKTGYDLSVDRGSVVRFYLTNAANTRTFRVHFDGAVMKRIGSDAGRSLTSEWVKVVTIAPSERAIVDVLFEEEGTYPSMKNEYRIMHEAAGRSSVLGIVRLTGKRASGAFTNDFWEPLHNDDVSEDIIGGYLRYFDKPVDKTIHLSVESMMARMMQQGGGMEHGGGHDGLAATPENDDGIEWEDPMPQQNAMSTKHNTKWKLIDEASAAENMDIAYDFKVGDKVKIRLVNDEESEGSDHLMQHPIHFHGQRFLVLAVDGEPNENLVWKDTVLVEKGQSVDILLDVTNPGDWMFHCHIAEHLSNGMMGIIKVQ